MKLLVFISLFSISRTISIPIVDKLKHYKRFAKDPKYRTQRFIDFSKSTEKNGYKEPLKYKYTPSQGYIERDPNWEQNIADNIENNRMVNEYFMLRREKEEIISEMREGNNGRVYSLEEAEESLRRYRKGQTEEHSIYRKTPDEQRDDVVIPALSPVDNPKSSWYIPPDSIFRKAVEAEGPTSEQLRGTSKDPYAGTSLSKDFVVPDELNCAYKNIKTYNAFKECVKLQRSINYLPVMQRK